MDTCKDCKGTGTVTRVDYRLDPVCQTVACACRQRDTIPAPEWLPEPPTTPSIVWTGDEDDYVYAATSLPRVS